MSPLRSAGAISETSPSTGPAAAPVIVAEARVLESAAASTITLDADRSAIQDASAIALVAEPVARALEPNGVAVIPLDPPPQYVVALAWRFGEQRGARHPVHRTCPRLPRSTWMGTVRAM